MSFDTLTWVRRQTVGNATAKHVLRVLADHAGQDHSCYLRNSLIAREAEVAETTVRVALARLIQDGFIRVYLRYDEAGRQRSNRYQLLVEGADTPPPDAEDWADVRERPEPAPGGQQPAGEGSAAGAPGGQQPAPIPYTEPTEKEAHSVKGAPRSERATRVPDDFQPDAEMRAWFVREQLGLVIDGVREHEQFMDYWRATPGARGRKLDWPATWRRWMREAAERAQRTGRRPGTALAPTSGAPNRSTTDERVAQGLALAKRYEEMGL